MGIETMPTFEKKTKGWKQRIIDDTKKSLETEVLNKVAKLNISKELENKVLIAINEKLDDDKFIQSRINIGNWEKKLAETENPDEEEDNLSKGLATKIKQDLSNDGFIEIFG